MGKGKAAFWKLFARPKARAADTVPTSIQSAIEEADRLIAGGNMLEDYSEFQSAADEYRKSVELAPSYVRGFMNLGNVLAKMGQHDEAVAAQRQAVACDPSYAPARFNLGSLLMAGGAFSPAQDELLEALRLQPDMFQAAVLLADLYETEGRVAEAEEQFLRALAIVPEHAGTMLNYGSFCFRQDRFDEALAWFERVKAAQPEFTDAESSLLFSTNFRADLDTNFVANEHRRVGSSIAKAAGPAFVEWPNAAIPERRLRVGYVSGDFLNHPVALFLRPVLERHDPAEFETFCYSNHSYPNPVAEALRERAGNWCDIGELDDTQVAERVRRDQIDILVDLSGHTRRNRLAVFARHPAPVQATWLGYLNTTGLTAMDYRITDANTDPEGETEHVHTETLIRLPHSQWCYAPWYEAAPVATPHASRPEAIVFGSFNQFRKISDPCLSIWCQLLKRVPEAELLVLDVKPAFHTELRDRVARNGIDPARVTIRGREVILEYFSTIGNVDIALDTFPYNGATTTLDTLWMGVPIVALRGDRGLSRGSYSILRSLGADDLIANDVEAYIELNVRLAYAAERRRELRDTLRGRLQSSPLMDRRGFVASLEACYRNMWRTWCDTTRILRP